MASAANCNQTAEGFFTYLFFKILIQSQIFCVKKEVKSEHGPSTDINIC